MKRIPLRGRAGVGLFALVDDEDYDQLAQHKWYIEDGYARRNRRRPARGKERREILGLVVGDGLEADHINGDRLDNRRSNLRVGDHALNQQNGQGAFRGSSSRFRGVSWHSQHQRWTARVRIDGMTTYLGDFAMEEDAGRAASEFRQEHMPTSWMDRRPAG